jgi:hypothetical protein
VSVDVPGAQGIVLVEHAAPAADELCTRDPARKVAAEDDGDERVFDAMERDRRDPDGGCDLAEVRLERRRSSAQSSQVGRRSVLSRSDAPVPRRSKEITLANEPSASRLRRTDPTLQRRSTCELSPRTNVRSGP